MKASGHALGDFREFGRRISIPRGLILGILALGLTGPIPAWSAQRFDEGKDEPIGLGVDQKREKERKKMGWFSDVPGLSWLYLKPARTNSAEQLAYAQQLESEGKTGKAEDAYLALVRAWHDSAEAPAAQLGYAKRLEGRGKYDVAFQEYQYLVHHFAGSFPYEEVLDHQFRIALQIMNERHMTLGIFQGFRSPEAALPLLEQIVANAPAWERTPEARFHIGLIHEEEGDHQEAIRAYEAIQQRHPRSSYVLQAAYRRAYCLYREAEDNARDERRCRNALSALASFAAAYPENEHTAEAKQCLKEMRDRLADLYYERAVFYDEKEHRPDSAIVAYTDFVKKFPTAPQAGKVRERLEALKEQVKNVDKD